MELAHPDARVLPVIDDGIDQGITRLAMLAFLRGEALPSAHAAPHEQGGDAWVRYRSHTVGRERTDNGFLFRLMHRDHDGTTRDAPFVTLDAEQFEHDAPDEDILVTLTAIDRMIDVIRAEYPDDYRPTEDVTADEAAVARVMTFIAEADRRGWTDDAVVFGFGAFASNDAPLILADVRRVASAVR